MTAAMGNPLCGIVELPEGKWQKIYMRAADMRAWSVTSGSWQIVTLQQRYLPRPNRNLPAAGRGGSVNAGERCAFPEPEAAALVRAGYATAVAGTPSQVGQGPSFPPFPQ